MEIQFLGAAGTVTGSKYLVTAGSTRILVDCGLFQGPKIWRLRNREPLAVAPADVDAVVLTHAHVDHSGYLPLLVRDGFARNVYCTAATRDLCRILLPDSGHLQEEEAEYANRHGFSKHSPALPLYTEADAWTALERIVPVPVATDIAVGDGVRVRLTPAGHMLGAATVRVEHGGTTVLFMGDLGRADDFMMKPPEPPPPADYLVVESTYGDRLHGPYDCRDFLAEVFNRTFRRGGAVIIPSFAVGRAQTLMYLIHLLKRDRRIPDVPVFLNSPMAIDATEVFRAHQGEQRLSPADCAAMCGAAKVVNSPEESKRLNERRGPMIVIAGNGMATGGRVVHHLKAFGPDQRNTILFVGYQVPGTRGAALLGGARSVKIHGDYVGIWAEVVGIDSLSGHADYAEILAWLKRCPAPPREVFVTHGEPDAAAAMRGRILSVLGWPARVPAYLDRVVLGGPAGAVPGSVAPQGADSGAG